MKTNTQSPNDALAEAVRKSREADMAELAKLREENARLKANQSRSGKLSLKVSEKGALSIYGMGRFPVTLYKSQWEALLADAQVTTIKEFIAAHESELRVKEATVPATGVTGGTATAPKAPEAGKAF